MAAIILKAIYLKHLNSSLQQKHVSALLFKIFTGLTCGFLKHLVTFRKHIT